MTSKAIQRQIQCEGKKRYGSWERAELVLARAVRRYRVRGLHPYHCVYCHGFHLGTSLAGQIAKVVKS